MTLNFSEYLDLVDGIEPLYQVEGKGIGCPPGFKYDKKTMKCVPKSDEDRVSNDRSGSKDMKPENGPAYSTIGQTGLNGDGYAYGESNNWDTNG